MHSVRLLKRFLEQSSRKEYSHVSDRPCTMDNLLWLIVGFGIALRLAQYLHNRSLWLDEAMLALNVVNRSVPELLRPLEYNQGAPIGFLVVQKLLADAFGTNEYVLRLFPLICGIASLILFPKVARHALAAAPAVIFATAAFAISYKLIFYASDVKQYSSDVAIALAVYSMTHHILDAGLNARRSLALGIIGAIAIWFSHPATFILAGIGVSLAGLLAYRKAWSSLWSVMSAGVLWALSFVAFYFVSLRQLSQNNPLLAYWEGGFMPFPPKTLSELRWFDETFFGFFREPLGLLPASLACAAFVTGCISLAFERKDQFLLLATPILFALVASGLHLYPFSERLLLFAVPFAIISIAHGISRLGGLPPKKQHRLSGAVALLLLVPQLIYSSAVFFRAYSFEEVKPAIAYVGEHWRPGDIVYVYHAARPTFRYYSGRYGFKGGDYVLGHASRKNVAGLKEELDAASSRQRLWVLFGHIDQSNGVDDDSLFRAQIAARKELADSFKPKGAAVYLYVNAAH
jgi:hypothetical protein